MDESPAGRQPPADPHPPKAPSDEAAYPLFADVVPQTSYSRLLPLVKWIIAFPHYVVITILGLAALFVIFAAFFVVLVTGRYPRGMFDFVVGVNRYGWRLRAYLFLLTDRYPQFGLGAEHGEPAPFSIEYPAEGVNRWRPLVQWLLVIPYAIVAGVLQNLAFVCAFFAFFTILFSRRIPPGLFGLILVPLRWNARSQAYAIWLTRRYPPFTWG